MTLSRRDFLASSACAMFGTLSAHVSPRVFAATATDRPMLGLDNFAVRGMGWKASRLIDYAASIDADSLFITDLDAFESFEAPYLAGVKAHAQRETGQPARRHVEHLSDLQGVQAEVGYRRGTPHAGHSCGARRGISSHSCGARHVGGSADRRRHRAAHRGDGQGLSCVPITRDRCRREDRHREPCRRHVFERSRPAGRCRGPRLRRRQSRLGQRALDPRGSAREPRGAGPADHHHQPA